MRKLLSKIIHKLFLRCSEATLLLEKRNAQTLSPKENQKLNVHLKICNLCKTYEKKLKILDHILKIKVFENGNVEITDSELQNFKEKMTRRLDI